MAQVTTRWTPFTTIPQVGSDTFPEDIDTRNAEMPSRMVEIDSIGQEMNVVADEVNTNAQTVATNTAIATNAALMATGTANNKGAWSLLTGALNVPASVNHNGSIWVLNRNIANVVLSEPTSLNIDWTESSGVTQFELEEVKTDVSNLETDVSNLETNKINEHFSKQNKKAVVFTKTAPSGFDVLPNKVELPNGNIANNTIAVSLSLNSNLDTGSKVAGYDYYVYCTASNTYNISRDKTKTDGTIIGGFHYGLVPETEAPTGNKTEAWMVEQRGIWSHSFWDLKFKPNSKYEEGKNYSNGKWVDIYQADEDIAIRGYSSPWKSVGVKAKIAAGTTDYGRGIPKIPLDFGGNGTVTYGKFTWFQACEIAKSLGMRLLTYEEFSPLAYGVTEGVSSSINGYETTAGAIEHYPHLTSRYMEQATGTQWIWGADVGCNYGTTDWDWRNNTDTRGKIYSTSNNPTVVILGGARGDGANAGSRASDWDDYVWSSSWVIGCRFACDHLELV